jgi:uncharacterized membrane protein HdeD (DUF308 family)
MFDLLSRRWWVFAIRGAVAIVFGVLTLVWPSITVLVLVMVYGFFAIVDGITHLAAAVGPAGRDARAFMVTGGVISLVAGIIAFAWPHITTLVLLAIIAIWAIVSGVVQIVAVSRLRRGLPGNWTYFASGGLSILFGVLLLVWPGAGAIALAWLIGLFAILIGVVLVAISLRLRGSRPGSAGVHRYA